MLPLERDGGEKSSVRRFLKVTDFTDGRANTGHGINICKKRWQDEADTGPSVADSGEGQEQEREQEQEEQQQWRTSRLDPLWEGLGSLGERLAGVGSRFDQLDQEICHDRQASESRLVRIPPQTIVVPRLGPHYSDTRQRGWSRQTLRRIRTEITQ